MPVAYMIDAVRGLVLSSATGELTDEELIAHQDGLRDDPEFDSSFSQVYDFSAVTGTNLRTDTIRKAAQRNPFKKTSRRAFVVSSPLLYGLVRVFLARASIKPEDGEVFATLDEAMGWLERE